MSYRLLLILQEEIEEFVSKRKEDLKLLSNKYIVYKVLDFFLVLEVGYSSFI